MQSATTENQWISFRVSDEIYAQPIATVKEVINYQPPAPVPGSPDQVEGVLNVRGEVITVISSHRLLGVVDDRHDPNERRILILDGDDERIGVVVNGVEEIVRIEPESIEVSEHSLDSGLVVGTARHQSLLLILLDLTADS